MNNNERAEILRKAVKIIKERGWSGPPVPNQGNICLALAVCEAAELPRNWSMSYPILGFDKDKNDEIYATKKMTQREQQSRWPWVWNDRYADGIKDVISMLEFLADTGMSWDDAIEIWFESKEARTEEIVNERELVEA